MPGKPLISLEIGGFLVLFEDLRKVKIPAWRTFGAQVPKNQDGHPKNGSRPFAYACFRRSITSATHSVAWALSSVASISKGNEKLGSIQSVSLPSGTTCRPCDCIKKCYARRIERRRPSVEVAYKTNLRVLTENPDVYWREVEAAIMLSRFFRFHVSGDIPNTTYLCRMVEVAKRNRHCEILCFTKCPSSRFHALCYLRMRLLTTEQTRSFWRRLQL